MLENLFKALGDKTRLEIFIIISLSSKLCLCDIEAGFTLSSSNLSRHLKELVQSDLLCFEKEGKWKFYYLSNVGKKLITIIKILLSKTQKTEIKEKVANIKKVTLC
jgi:ArsR family transcriptional regulator